MPSDQILKTSDAARDCAHRPQRNRKARTLIIAVLCALTSASLVSCIVPMDTGAAAAAMALDEMDNLAYSINNETAQLQVQIDSLSTQLRKTDSLLRWVANLTGNPIADAPNWANFSFPTLPDTGAVTTTTKPPPDSGTARTKPPPR